MTPIAKRPFLAGLASLLGAPAIVRAENIMPVKRMSLIPPPSGYVMPDDVVLRLGGDDLLSGYELLNRWVAGVRDVIEAERRAQADLRAVLDNTNALGGWGLAGDVSISMVSRTKEKYRA